MSVRRFSGEGSIISTSSIAMAIGFAAGRRLRLRAVPFLVVAGMELLRACAATPCRRVRARAARCRQRGRRTTRPQRIGHVTRAAACQARGAALAGHPSTEGTRHRPKMAYLVKMARQRVCATPFRHAELERRRARLLLSAPVCESSSRMTIPRSSRRSAGGSSCAVTMSLRPGAAPMPRPCSPRAARARSTCC